MNRTFGIAVVVAIVLGLGLGAGTSAWQMSSQPKAAARSTAQANGAGSGTQSQNGAAAAQGQGARPVTGTVEQVDGKNLTLQAQSGSVKVVLADNATFSKLDTAAVADLKAGANVMVVGQQEGDSVAATSVQILGDGATAQAAGGFAGQSGQFGQGRQSGQGNQSGQTGQSGQSGQSGAQRTRVLGKVQSVDGQNVTVTATDGTATKVAISPTTTLQKMATATVSDLKAGVNVLVTGDTAADGTVTARSVEITPARSGN